MTEILTPSDAIEHCLLVLKPRTFGDVQLGRVTSVDLSRSLLSDLLIRPKGGKTLCQLPSNSGRRYMVLIPQGLNRSRR